jgi:shikimate O-hydroxycinnamoyltransferase
MGANQKARVAAESCMVTPSEDTPRHDVFLTAIDLTWVTRGHTPTVHLYDSGSGADDGFFDVARLKAALAKALVPYYPLAGRLGVDSDGRPVIDCAGQGVLFVVAHSDLTVDDLSTFHPSPELKRLFVPRVEDYSPALMCGIQVNFLKCGGVALGMTLHHVAVDAISAFNFFQAFSAFSRDVDGASAAALQQPFHDRTLLRARSPPVVHPDALTVFCPRLAPSDHAPPGAVVNEIFVFSKDQVAALKRACTSGDGGGRVSIFCAFSAHVWRCLCAARRLPLDDTTRLTFPANVRRSVKPPLPDSYFGNGIVMLGTAGKVGEITGSEQLAAVAARIRDVIDRMDDELVHSVIDYMHMAGSQTAFPAGSMPETELRVVSWRGMPVFDADFGWGKPLVVQRAVQPRAGIVYLIDGVGGSVRILLSMEPAIVDDFRRLMYANV